jgi:tetratricopeptide (TPR) repeat protein
MADMATLTIQSEKVEEEAIVAYAVGNPYPPCALPFQELKSMRISELKMGTHHRGRVMSLRRVAPVARLKLNSWTVVGDEEGGVERLEVGMHGQDLLDRIPEGEVFKVLEPWFTMSEVEQEEATIRVEHPSDLLVVTEDGGDYEKTAIECKEEGNTALRKKDLRLAHEKYTQGLEIISRGKEGVNGEKENDMMEKDLFRNRAHVNLLLSRFDAAKSDALSSITSSQSQKHEELDGKAFLRAGLASYSLGNFREAKKYFEEHARLMGGDWDKEARARIRKIACRIREEETGIYDFKKLKASLLLSNSASGARIDAASFLQNVRIGQSSGRGRGLFATRDLKPGDVIMVEKAFCVVFGQEENALSAMTFDVRDEMVRVFPAGLCKAVVRKLNDNPSQIGKVLDLYSDYQVPEIDNGMAEGRRWVDVWQVHDIVARNAFGPGGSGDGEKGRGWGSAGLWIVASYMNHSCVPNAEKEYIGDLMVLRATREIKAGDEVMHTYVQVNSDFAGRGKSLLEVWGFVCDCGLCVAERGDEESVREKRRRLEREAEALMDEKGGSRLAVMKIRKLGREIEGTYTGKRWEGLPKLAVERLKERMEKVIKRY